MINGRVQYEFAQYPRNICFGELLFIGEFPILT